MTDAISQAREDYWRGRLESVESRYIEKCRVCAAQHIALGQIMDVVGDIRDGPGTPQDPYLIHRLEEILNPYARKLKQFRMAEWALEECDDDGQSPPAGDRGP